MMYPASEFPRFKEILLDHIASLETAIKEAPKGDEDAAVKKVIDDFRINHPE